jgi:putative ABC transport system permease protein
MFGAPERGPAMPAIAAGRTPSTPDEIAVSSTLGRSVGDDLQIASRTLRIVGIVDDSTALANQPNVFLTVAGAERLLFSGQPLASSVGLRGTRRRSPTATGPWTAPARSTTCCGRCPGRIARSR